MKKNIVILICILMLSRISYAQDNYCNCGNEDDFKKNIQQKILGSTFFDNYRGDDAQYFNYWTDGDILLTNGYTIQNKQIRYNVLTSELLWLRKSDYKAAIVDNNFIKSFVIHENEKMTNAIFEKKTFSRSNQKKQIVWLQLLNKGNISLYANRKAEVISTDDKLVAFTHYYLFLNDEFIKFRNNRFFLLKTLPKENRQKMKLIIRKNHLSIKNENHLIAAFSLYNE